MYSDSTEDDSTDEELDWKESLEIIFKENGEIKKVATVNEAFKKKKIEKLKHAMHKNYYQLEG